MKNSPDQPQDPEPLEGLRVFGEPDLVVSGPGSLQTSARELHALRPRVMRTYARGIQTLPPREMRTSTGFTPPSGPTVRRGFWAGLWDRFRGR